jgi:hypothetical protein
MGVAEHQARLGELTEHLVDPAGTRSPDGPRGDLAAADRRVLVRQDGQHLPVYRRDDGPDRVGDVHGDHLMSRIPLN